MSLITLEILLAIVTLLLALYLRGQWPLRTMTACMCGIAVVWYLTYSLIHDLCRALPAIVIVGVAELVKSVQAAWASRATGAPSAASEPVRDRPSVPHHRARPTGGPTKPASITASGTSSAPPRWSPLTPGSFT